MLKGLPLIISLLVLISSCKKESMQDPASPPAVPLSADSNYLSKVLYINKSGSSFDSVIKSYLFDNLKRVTSESELYTDGGVNKDSFAYVYSGTQVLPYKTVYYSSGQYQRDTIVSFLYYNSLGQLIRDSSMSFRHYIGSTDYSIQKSISAYTYTGNKIYSSLSAVILAGYGQPYFQKDTLTLDGNKNVIEKRSFNYSFVGGLNTSRYVRVFTYDNKPSHYSQLNINNIYPTDLYDADPLYYQLGTKNNRLSINETEYQNGILVGTYNDDFIGKYTYKANGFPSSIFYPYPPSGDYDKFVFIYRSF